MQDFRKYYRNNLSVTLEFETSENKWDKVFKNGPRHVEDSL